MHCPLLTLTCTAKLCLAQLAGRLHKDYELTARLWLCARPTAQCVARLLWLLPAFVAAFEAPFAQYALVDAVGSPADATATAADLPLWFVASPNAVPPFHIHVHMRDSVGAVRQRVAEAYGCVAGLLPDALFQVQHTGGPPVRAELLFRIGNQSVSNVSALGPQLTGIMHGFDDEHVTYGEDVVQVHVRLLSGVRVHTP